MAISHSKYYATQVRGGEIILRRPWQRVIFFSGLFGGVVLLAWALVFGF